MLLNYQLSGNKKQGTIVFIHGLFGSLSNLGMLARGFQDQYQILQIDVRNHGKSPHHDTMQYSIMAEDIIETIDSLPEIDQFIVVGHSMGGKIAMSLSNLAAHRILKMIVLDMAPYAYHKRHHDDVFQALFAVKKELNLSRQQATEIMRQHLKDEMIVQFLMKSFHQGTWLFNLDSLYQNYSQILSWDTIQSHVDTLFIRGSISPYVEGLEKEKAIFEQFPNSKIKIIEDAGHWLHAQKTSEVLNEIKFFLA